MVRRSFDFYLLLPVFFLSVLGIAIIASVSPANFANHLVFLLVGMIFFVIFSVLDLNLVFPFMPILYLASLVFLCLPFVFGTASRGAVRWIPLGPYTIQPSELAKPLAVLLSAWYWDKKKFGFKHLLGYSLYLLPFLLLIFLQPDLGSALVVASIYLGTIAVSGIKLKQLLVLVIAGALLLPLGWFSLRDYQKLRVINFLSPYSDPLGEGYNLIQSKISIGSGGFFGLGLGRGTQSHLFFLPERHTDFVFASLSEELGFAGSFLVAFLYFLLLLRFLKIASQSRERRDYLSAIGIFFFFAFQVTTNIGMNIGLLPITGITLPLISYGGSSLLATMISLGIMENLSRSGDNEGVIEIK